MAGNGRSRELCEALELAPTTLQADHLRFFTCNHSKPSAATINTAMMLHCVDDVGSSLGVDVVGFASGAFFGAGGSSEVVVAFFESEAASLAAWKMAACRSCPSIVAVR